MSKILAIVGMAGAGKSTVVDYLTEKGYPKVYFGGVIYEAMKEAGLTPGDWPRETKFREEIREREGKDFAAKRIAKQLHNLIAAGQHKLVADGLYSWTEYKTLSHEFPGQMTVIAVTAPRSTRKKRLAGRPERPLTSEEVDKRDWAEIENMEKGGPIAIADYTLMNDGATEELFVQLEKVLHEIDFYA